MVRSIVIQLFFVVFFIQARSIQADSTSIDSNSVQIEQLFADSEPDSILYSPELRGFRVNSMVSAKMIDSRRFMISNFTPAQFDSVIVWKHNTTDSSAIFRFYAVPPFTRMIIPINPEIVSPDSTSQLSLSCEDSLFRKLSEITVPWFVSFSSHQGGDWAKVTPIDARRYCAAMTNFAWLVCSDRFRSGYLQDTNYVLLNNRTNKAGDSVNPVIDREQLYQRIIHHKEFSLGKIESDRVVGLGVWTSTDDTSFVGAFQEHSFLGIHYFAFYNRQKCYAMRVLAHETGHIMGFTHESTIARDDDRDIKRTGFPWMVGTCYSELLNARKLPFVEDPFDPSH